MVSSLPVELTQIRCRLGLGNFSTGCCNDLFQAGRHGKSQQLYGRGIESFVISLSNQARQRRETVSLERREYRMKKKTVGAIEGTRTPTPLRVHGPEPCASANSATMAKSDSLRGDLFWPPLGENHKQYSTGASFAVKR